MRPNITRVAFYAAVLAAIGLAWPSTGPFLWVVLAGLGLAGRIGQLVFGGLYDAIVEDLCEQEPGEHEWRRRL